MNSIITPCVFQTIVICISIIIIVSCILKLIRILRKPATYNHNLSCDNCHHVKRVSYRFVIGILAGIVVLLFSLRYYEIENIFDFMSFASAVISIILAVLTIIYTYYTQGTTTLSAEKIEKSSAAIKEATVNIASATGSYSKTADSLQENIQKILDKLDGISARVEFGPDYANTVKFAARQELAETILKDFAKNSPPAGVLLVYACSKVQSTGKQFNLSDVFPSEMLMYYIGFAVSLNSIGAAQVIVDIEVAKITTAVVSPHLTSCIFERIDEEIRQGNQFIIENKNRIDELFNS